ncbi:prolactin-releasing peptide receptor [Drosophila grimshawi]|uniref:GH16355 n=1 Tax=Drosophila grimshawi TaxID=7222 RepID=B4IYT2_DROGR|nr:prolactin-releasing peptide receptor [Drosophila grimshawi]XP_032599075.1 prolactin-releasing peptide receptor [Drosophila grimshawi]XP_032599076.1 prolactin-releasing peptide receptor [Drosophila grimshawi]EDV96619.1 GH16355 [Drosophila grimshawi]
MASVGNETVKALLVSVSTQLPHVLGIDMGSNWSSSSTTTATTTTISTTTTTTMATPSSSTIANTISIVDADAADGDKSGIIHNQFVQIFFYVLYTTVFVLGVFGNVLVCYVVLRNRAMQTVTNIFITNLALSDILLCVLAVPFTPLYTFMGRWAFGRTLCHLVSFAQGCSIYISTLTLTSIAIDRYFVIIYPFHPRMKLSTCIGIIVSIWVIALLATVPYGMYMKMTNEVMDDSTQHLIGANGTSSVNGSHIDATSAAQAYMQVVSDGVTVCEENWPSEHYRKVFGAITTTLQFVLPFFIISICYVWISVKLNQRARAKPGSKSSRREEADRDRKKRTNRMLIAMVAVFGLSWLPINLVNIFDDFDDKSNEWRLYMLFFFVAHSIAMSSTCYNPFLYAWLNENFRKEFKHVLPCFNPSNNNIINITRGYNRSDRNTCGPRLHHGNGEGGGAGSLDVDDQDENGITQETCLPKEKLLIIPREPTYGNGTGAVSPILSARGINAALLHANQPQQLNQQQQQQQQVELTRRGCRRRDDDGDYIDSGDEQTVEVRFIETPFVSSDNTTGNSMLEASESHCQDQELAILGAVVVIDGAACCQSDASRRHN